MMSHIYESWCQSMSSGVHDAVSCNLNSNTFNKVESFVIPSNFELLVATVENYSGHIGGTTLDFPSVHVTK